MSVKMRSAKSGAKGCAGEKGILAKAEILIEGSGPEADLMGNHLLYSPQW